MQALLPHRGAQDEEMRQYRGDKGRLQWNFRDKKSTVTPVTGVVLLFCFVTAVCYSPITELFIL